ncbi:maleylpyruvate isomerase family mycothiol-dependent enzyme [Candidatus Entotheonella palauensis]|uniref:maleylpyruvate isomerase family mycothiol-dependent enzyme n=1 Tax=Candidatus Entotheonella palauensis TaxID=93172 RepID=UPI000B7DEDBB|nr:maleylpyruvate isomerase family mycothiol-dependent enzyme [Candidatus Entotheonella palauensis]
MDAPGDRIELLQAESERLKQYLTTLPPDAWHQPSACDRWQVRDVVAHLAGTAEFYMAVISGGLQGDASPPEALRAAGTASASSFHDMNAQMAISYRERLGTEVLATFTATNDKLNQLLTGLGPNDWNTPCYHPIGGTIPVRTFVELRLRELAIHGWDIRSRFELAPQLSRDSLPVLMQDIARLVSRSFRAGSRLPVPVRYRFELTGAGSVRTVIVVEGDQVHVENAGETATHVTLGCDTETFVLLMYGRIVFDSAVSEGQISVEGDREQAAQFGQWFGA